MKQISFYVAFLATLVSCGATDLESSHPSTGYRCVSDGPCFTKKSRDLFSGAYRKGDREIEFDVAYRPSVLNAIHQGSAYCNRLVLEAQHGYVLDDNGNCPKSWHELYSYEFIVSHEDAMDEYPMIAKEMRTVFKNLSKPSEISKEQWGELRYLLDATPPVPPVTPPELPGKQKSTTWSLAEDLRPQIYYEYPKQIHITRKRQGEDQLSQSLGSSAASSGRGETVTPSARFEWPGYEFRQDLELWSQKTLLFIKFGPETHDDHSATLSHVMFRRIGSPKWKALRDIATGNHGAKPKTERMNWYTTCAGPITENYYAVGGECEGGWLIEHLCNDDTAYQVFHALGYWNGGTHCLGKRRPNRPWCGKPW